MQIFLNSWKLWLTNPLLNKNTFMNPISTEKYSNPYLSHTAALSSAWDRNTQTLRRVYWCTSPPRRRPGSTPPRPSRSPSRRTRAGRCSCTRPWWGPPGRPLRGGTGWRSRSRTWRCRRIRLRGGGCGLPCRSCSGWCSLEQGDCLKINILRVLFFQQWAKIMNSVKSLKTCLF